MLVLAASIASAALIEVTVLDTAGKPVPTAELRLADEGGDIHRVNPATGRWSDRHLYTPGGHSYPIEKGETYRMQVYAPGYAMQELEVDVESRTQPVQVELQPLHITDEALAEQMRAWDAAVREMLVDRAPESHEAVYQTRLAVVAESKAWIARTEVPEQRRAAFNLCRQAAYATIQCTD